MAEGLPEKNSFWEGRRLDIAVIGLFFFGLFLASVGLGLYFFKNKPQEDIQIISSESPRPSSISLVVDVGGAVVRPGLYKLPQGARINDAILAAGGLSTTADSSKINLAAKISDAEKIHIASVGESVTAEQGTSNVQSSLININTASESELDKLPQVGPATAQKIIASRPYSSLQELLTKKAVSSAVFEKIKSQITY